MPSLSRRSLLQIAGAAAAVTALHSTPVRAATLPVEDADPWLGSSSV